jgi:proteasome accessory factor C
MAKTSQELERLLTLIPFLNSRNGVPVSEVAEELGVEESQLLRDLDQLCLLGIPPFGPNDLFMASVDEQGRLEMAYAEQFSHPLHLTPQEAVALRLRLLPLSAGGPFAPAVRSILEKIDAALLPRDRAAVEQLDGSVSAAPARGENREVLETVKQARRRLRELEISYYSGSTGEFSQRTVRVYGFVMSGGFWYAVAHCNKSKEIRTFKLSRIKEARLLPGSYAIPGDFDISYYAQGHIFRPSGQEKTVRLWFSPRIARWIMERNPEAKKMKDGSAQLSLKARNYAWIARWMLNYGPEAEILEPKEARDQARKILESSML